MRSSTYYRASIFILTLFVVLTSACSESNKKNPTVKNMEQELATIDSLLQDSSFAQSMAAALEAAYYMSEGKPVPAFITPQKDSSVIARSLREEKIATNVAGFYALECGINFLSETTHELPFTLLEKIVQHSLDPAQVSLLNRFANATWKAGQPFRALERIQRNTFICFNHLPPDEIEKDAVQINNAAIKLLEAMKPVANDSLPRQMEQLRGLLHDSVFAIDMASWLESQYYISQHQQVPPFLTISDSVSVKKTVNEIKIATNIAGFYALECGLNYLAATKQAAPSQVMHSIVDNTISHADQMIFARFANATWKAGQPFRGLSRITRETFEPFYFLTAKDIEKDLVQIRAAAKKLLSAL